MDIIKQIKERRAYRALSPEPVTKESVIRIIKAATLAPSCSNNQPWRFLILDDPDTLEAGRRALTPGNYWAAKAPVLIIALTKKDLDSSLSGNREYALFDTGMAVMNLQLQAVAEGLRIHPMAGFKPEVIKEAFDISDEWIAITVIAIAKQGSDAELSDSHKAKETAPQERKPVEEIAFYNSWTP